MTNQSVTPADIFADLLRFRAPAAIAWVRGGDAAPNLSGLVKFYQTPYSGVLVEAEIFNLPNKQEPGSTDFYAMHIHQNGDCSDDFTKTGDHYKSVRRTSSGPRRRPASPSWKRRLCLAFLL